MADTPPDFIIIRAPAQVLPTDAYPLALELVERVQVILDHTTARYQLKARLDEVTTTIALRVARATLEPKNRWRHVRGLLELITDLMTMLDILDRQRASTKVVELDQARAFARSLHASLMPLAQLGLKS